MLPVVFLAKKNHRCRWESSQATATTADVASALGRRQQAVAAYVVERARRIELDVVR